MITLALDTSAHLCAAAVHDSTSDTILCENTQDIGRGHAERLMEIIATVLQGAKLDYSSIDLVAATRGPGSFTGIRVGLATARGIGLGLGAPVTGISTLEAMHAAAIEKAPETEGKPALALIDARRGEVYAQCFDCGPQWPAEPFCVAAKDLAQRLAGELPIAGSNGLSVCGSGAKPVREALAQIPDAAFDLQSLHELDAAPIATIARLAASRQRGAEPPVPLYLRAPDAKPQSGFAVARL